MKALTGFVAAAVLFFASRPTVFGDELPDTRQRDVPVAAEKFRFPRIGTKPVLLALHLGGRSFDAVLDTGSTVTVFDTRLRADLGPFVGVQRTKVSGGKLDVERFVTPEFRIGRIQIARGSGTVACVDLAMFRPHFGESVFALVGMDVLRSRAIRVDFNAGTASFLARSPPKSAAGVPLRYFGGTPWIMGAVGTSVIAWFQLDTGCAADLLGGLSNDLFENLRMHGSLAPLRGGLAVGVKGTSMTPTGRLTVPLVIGGRKIDSAIFAKSAHCSLGLEYLSRYIVTFDFPNDVVYFDLPGGPLVSLGVQTSRRRGQLVVVAVADRSRAATVGLRKDDVITSVNAVAAMDANEERLREEVGKTGEAITVSVLRGGKTIEMSFAPLWTSRTLPRAIPSARSVK